MPDIFGTKGRKHEADGLGIMADTRFYGGPSAHIFDTAKFANGALIGEKCYFGKIPSRCPILPQSVVHFGAFGAGCTLNIGDDFDPDGLATLVSVAAGASTPLLEAVSAELIVKPVWELLGYAKDPDRRIDLYASIAGANVSTATAWLTWSILFGRG